MVAILPALVGGGAVLGGFENWNNQDINRANAERIRNFNIAAIKNAPLVKYALMNEQKVPNVLQGILTGAGTGLEAGLQLGMAQSLIDKYYPSKPSINPDVPLGGPLNPNQYNGESFSPLTSPFGPESDAYSGGQYELPGDYEIDMWEKTRAPSAWDTFVDPSKSPRDNLDSLQIQKNIRTGLDSGARGGIPINFIGDALANRSVYSTFGG